MLKKIDVKNVGILSTLIIIKSSIFKILRGFLIKPFLRKSNGFIFVGTRVSITDKNKITTGRNVKFEKNSEIQGLSKLGLTFKDNVTIGNSAMIRPSSYYGVEVGEGLIVGENSSIGPLCYIGCAGYIEIGNNVMIGPRVSLFAENHNFNNTNTTIKSQGINRKGIRIGDDCWIGSGVIILDGVTVGKGCIIAAGTLVTKDIADYSMIKDKRVKKILDRGEK